AKFLKPCFLMTDLSSTSYLALALFDKTVPCITCSTAADMSFWAAINPSTCFSVSLICVTATCACTLVLTKTTAIAAIMRRSIWCMAEPPALRILNLYTLLLHPSAVESALGPRQNNGGDGSLSGRPLNNAGVAIEQHNAVRGQTAMRQ